MKRVMLVFTCLVVASLLLISCKPEVEYEMPTVPSIGKASQQALVGFGAYDNVDGELRCYSDEELAENFAESNVITLNADPTPFWGLDENQNTEVSNNIFVYHQGQILKNCDEWAAFEYVAGDSGREYRDQNGELWWRVNAVQDVAAQYDFTTDDSWEKDGPQYIAAYACTPDPDNLGQVLCNDDKWMVLPFTSHCANDETDGDETDLNCGGDLCELCVPGNACLDDDDCTGTCVDNVCLEQFEAPEGLGDTNVFVGDSFIHHHDGVAWERSELEFPQTNINDIFGFSPANVYAAGLAGAGPTWDLVHYDGNNWNIELEDISRINNIWGSSPNSIYAAGDLGESDIILYYDGNQWLDMPLGIDFSGSSRIIGMAGSSEDNIYATVRIGGQSDDMIIHYDGNSWAEVDLGVGNFGLDPLELGPVWVFDDGQVYATTGNILEEAGDFAFGHGSLLHYNGVQWELIRADVGEYRSSFGLSGWWGTSPNDFYAVAHTPGVEGAIFHYDGNDWARVMNTPQPINDLWGTSSNDIYAASSRGKLWRYDGNQWALMDIDTERSLVQVWATS